MEKHRKLIVACPHGFCAGVVRAVAMAKRALETHEHPVYCFMEIVHNQMVVEDLNEHGMTFISDVDDIPQGATVLLSAHGVSPAVRETVARRAGKVIDATCPFVAKVHAEVRGFAVEGCSILMIGKPDHQEVQGVVGECPGRVQVVADPQAALAVRVPDPEKVAVVMQTTLSLEDSARVLDTLRARFPALRTPKVSDICYATENRQQAVRELAASVERIIILGAHNSSNSNRLVEVASEAGRSAVLINSRKELAALDLSDVRILGLSAGASTPENFVEIAVTDLRRLGFDDVETLTTAEEYMAFHIE